MRSMIVFVALIIVVVGLTAVEKYRERGERLAIEAEAAQARLAWENRLNRMFDERWRDLSAGVRSVLDSLAQSVLADMGPGDPIHASTKPVDSVPDQEIKGDEEAADLPEEPPSDRVDSLRWMVASDYDGALAALPADLSPYEQRVAIDEVAFLMRSRYALTEREFDSLLALTSESENP